MTSFNTCAYPGCYCRIAYHVGETPEKYCDTHNDRNRSNLVTDPHYTTKDEKIPESVKMVILRCPRCKQRYEITQKDWMNDKIPACICGGGRLFHKEKSEPKTLHERASIQNDSIGWN